MEQTSREGCCQPCHKIEVTLKMVKGPLYLSNYENWGITTEDLQIFLNEKLFMISSKADNGCVPMLTSTVALPSVEVSHMPLFVDLELPSYGNVRQVGGKRRDKFLKECQTY